MTSDVFGISRLVGAARAAEPAAATPTGAAGFVTTVQRASDIAPFETVVKRAAAAQEARASQPGAAPSASAPLAPPTMSPAAKATKAQKSFEAFALQTFIGSMLPKENSKMFGTGNAGKMWQSLLAEKLADQITASGRLKLLPQQQGGTTVAGAAIGAPAAAGTADVTAPASAAAVQEGTKRLDAAGSMTPAALQQIVGSLRPGRSGGAR